MPLPHRRHAEESGVASAELVLAMPVLLFVLMLMVQFGLWYHGAHVATAAAQEGARTAGPRAAPARPARPAPAISWPSWAGRW